MINIPEYETNMVPTCNDHGQIVRQPYNTVSDLDLNPVGPKAIENGYNGMKDPLLHLSQNMKLAMRHVGKVENAIEVKDEWTWDPEQGMAVPPQGRGDIATSPYAKCSETMYSDYGDVERKPVEPYVDDPSGEIDDSVFVTEPSGLESTDDEDMVDAIPVLAVNNLQQRRIKTEGRRGEVHDDPITPENYLTRPGMEVKTSETYLGPDTINEGLTDAWGADGADAMPKPGNEDGKDYVSEEETEPAIYSVTLMMEGLQFADGSETIVQYTQGEVTQLPMLANKEDGSVFVGWSTTESGENPFTEISADDIGDLILYPVFAASKKRAYTKKTTTTTTTPKVEPVVQATPEITL